MYTWVEEKSDICWWFIWRIILPFLKVRERKIFIYVFRRRRKSGSAKNLCFGDDAIKRKKGLHNSKQACWLIKWHKVVLHFILNFYHEKDLQYIPKKSYSYSALTLQVPCGFLTITCLARSLSEYTQMHVTSILALKSNKKAMSCTVCFVFHKRNMILNLNTEIAQIFKML